MSVTDEPIPCDGRANTNKIAISTKSLKVLEFKISDIMFFSSKTSCNCLLTF